MILSDEQTTWRLEINAQKESQVIHIYHIYPTPPLGQFFKRSLTGLNSEFSFS